MRVLIIAEGRTGGTTLMDYLKIQFPNHKLITEPYTNREKGWIETDDVTNVEWYKEYDNVIVKEIYKDEYDFTNLINSSDKVFCIYRKNWYEQVRSILYSEQVGFIYEYNISDVEKSVTNDMILQRYLEHHKPYKKSFQSFIKRNNFINVTYEDLYYGNGIDVIKEYLNINSIDGFPPVKRYLKDSNGQPYTPQLIKEKII